MWASRFDRFSRYYNNNFATRRVHVEVSQKFGKCAAHRCLVHLGNLTAHRCLTVGTACLGKLPEGLHEPQR